MTEELSGVKVVPTSCTHDCGGRCILKVHVSDGAITRIEGDDGQEPQLRACPRGRAYRQRIYAPDRLKFPLRRVGNRGEGKFRQVSWDEALDTVAAELKRVKKTYGPLAILHYSLGGSLGLLHGAPWGTNAVLRLLNMFGGCTSRAGFVSNEGSQFASLATYGTLNTGNMREDLLNSRLIIMWGWNPADTVSETNTSFRLAEAKQAGVRIISVDPRFTGTAATFSSQWIPIRPGTDAAMLIAMADVMIREGLHDMAFLDRHATGFPEFRDYVLGVEDRLPKTPEWAEAITGVPAATIENLAREYATLKPGALIAGWSPGRTAYGEQFHRAAMTLAAMTGNVGVQGGSAAGFGRAYSAKIRGIRMPHNPAEATLPARKDSLPVGHMHYNSAEIRATELFDAILRGKSGGYAADYRLLYVTNANPLNQLLNVNRGIEAFAKPEFIVVHEQFMTATAKLADMVLPVNTCLERNDISLPFGFIEPYYVYLNKAISSMHESKSDLEICTELAPRLGIAHYGGKTEDEWLREFVERCDDIPDYDAFKRDGNHRVKYSKPTIAFEKQIQEPDGNPFPTPSGKIEIYSQILADMGNPWVPPIPKYIEPWEGSNDPLAQKYPLSLVTFHVRNRVHSQFYTVPWLKELEHQTVWINSNDAKCRGIENGDEVKVFNDRGQMIIRAKVTERVMPGVVAIGEGAWHTPDKNHIDRGGCPNVLTTDEHSPGGAFCSNTCLVQIEGFSQKHNMS